MYFKIQETPVALWKPDNYETTWITPVGRTKMSCAQMALRPNVLRPNFLRPKGTAPKRPAPNRRRRNVLLRPEEEETFNAYNYTILVM